MADYQKEDYYKRLAEESGYRSRAAFKLKQIDDKFKILKKGQRVLDLGAAPGSWMQVALERVGEKGYVLGVDLLPIAGLEQKNAETMLGDLLENETIDKIKEKAGDGFDTVLADVAPSTIGIKVLDTGLSAQLDATCLYVAEQTLKKNGSFIVKVLEGKETEKLKQDLKADFKQVKEFKPKASRKGSKETYLIGIGFKRKK